MKRMTKIKQPTYPKPYPLVTKIIKKMCIDKKKPHVFTDNNPKTIVAT
jgi:hypothetical protein